MSSDPQYDKASADPVRPQETLRDRIDRTIYDAAHYWPTPLGHDESADLADAVLPIVEEETKALRAGLKFATEKWYEAENKPVFTELAALRDKVKALADEWEHKAGGIEVDRITGMHLRNAVRRLRALVEEPQPRSGRDVYFDNLRKTAGPRVLAIIDKMQAVEEPQGGEQ